MDMILLVTIFNKGLMTLEEYNDAVVKAGFPPILSPKEGE
jgi:hypothetical protein